MSVASVLTAPVTISVCDMSTDSCHICSGRFGWKYYLRPQLPQLAESGEVGWLETLPFCYPSPLTPQVGTYIAFP